MYPPPAARFALPSGVPDGELITILSDPDKLFLLKIHR